MLRSTYWYLFINIVLSLCCFKVSCSHKEQDNKVQASEQSSCFKDEFEKRLEEAITTMRSRKKTVTAIFSKSGSNLVGEFKNWYHKGVSQRMVVPTVLGSCTPKSEEVTFFVMTPDEVRYSIGVFYGLASNERHELILSVYNTTAYQAEIESAASSSSSQSSEG